ncbi:MAG: hypothetical protein KA162_07230 [Xanthomonadales bacterium]|nr:hypothetical protein [Xanthomonadales bacterium]
MNRSTTPGSGAIPATVLLPILLGLAASVATASTPGRIESIRVDGNDTTREPVILREMDLAPGDEADAAAIERNRQSILDLGLFREVAIATEPGASGVVLVVTVREKRYLLAYPRLDYNSDEDFSYGAQLRWSNVGGRNHRLDAYFEKGDFPNDRDRSSNEEVRIAYRAPYIAGTRLKVGARIEHEEQRTLAESGDYDESFDRAELILSHDGTRGRPRAGWTLGGGLYWLDQSTDGATAPPEDGSATAGVFVAGYQDLRFGLYSDTGRNFGARFEAASEDLGSDYDYTRTIAGWFESRPLGDTPDQTLHFLAQGGLVTDGPGTRNEFSLGGSSRLRGYEGDFVQGNRYYYGAVEYLRPLHWRWLRLLAVAEAGGADDDFRGEADGSPYASLGLGVRVRLTWFVDIEIEAGFAVPLRDGDGVRFFAGAN